MNVYFSSKIINQSTPACLKYDNIRYDTRAFEMFISSNLQGSLYQASVYLDAIIDATIPHLKRKDAKYKIKNPIEYLELMKQLLTLIEHYTLLGNYPMSRLIEVVSFVLGCCEILNSYPT